MAAAVLSRHQTIESCVGRHVCSHCRVNRHSIIESCRGREVCSRGYRSRTSTAVILSELAVHQC